MADEKEGAWGFLAGFLILIAVCVAIAWWLTS